MQAARTRFRPILMTSLAFILGVIPLVTATGAGSEMRQSLGTTVFAGMLGVTLFGLIFTPSFYVVVQSLAGRRGRAGLPVSAHRSRARGMSEGEARGVAPGSESGAVSRPYLVVKRGHLGRYRFTLLAENGRLSGEVRIEMDGAPRAEQDAHARAEILRLAGRLVSAAEVEADVTLLRQRAVT